MRVEYNTKVRELFFHWELLVAELEGDAEWVEYWVFQFASGLLFADAAGMLLEFLPVENPTTQLLSTLKTILQSWAQAENLSRVDCS